MQEEKVQKNETFIQKNSSAILVGLIMFAITTGYTGYKDLIGRIDKFTVEIKVELKGREVWMDNIEEIVQFNSRSLKENTEEIIRMKGDRYTSDDAKRDFGELRDQLNEMEKQIQLIRTNQKNNFRQ